MKTRKLFVLAVAAMMIISTMTACSSQSAAKVSAPALMSRLTQYNIDFETGEWYEKAVTEYEYENAYPVSIRMHDNDAEEDRVFTFKYTFKDGQPSEMKRFNEAGKNNLMCSYTEKGLRDRDHYYEDDSTTELVYQYGDGGDFFTMVHHETLGQNSEDPDGPKEHAEEIDSVIITAKDGLMEKTVNDGLYANWGDGEEKIWYRFMGTYTMNYDVNGIVQSTYAYYSNGVGTGEQDQITLTVSDGRVTEAVVSKPFYDDNEEQYWQEMTKYVFEYTDIEISPARYAFMINDVLMEGGGNYYIYNWY